MKTSETGFWDNDSFLSHYHGEVAGYSEFCLLTSDSSKDTHSL